MNERKVLTLELTEAEALGLLELARWGDDARRTFALQMPECTTQLAAETAIKKLTRGISVEQGCGGNFNLPPEGFAVSEEDLWHHDSTGRRTTPKDPRLVVEFNGGTNGPK